MLPDTIIPAPAETSTIEQTTTETASGQNRRAYYIAASMMLVYGLSSLAAIAALGQTAMALTALFDLFVAIGLFQLRPGARKLALLRVVLGGTVDIFLAFRQKDPVIAIITAIAVLGYSGAIALLLNGRSRRWRLVLATGIFVVFSLSCYIVGLVGIALGYRR